MGAHSSHLCPRDLNELRQATLFTNEELQAWYHGFLKDCPTGKLTFNKFREIYAGFFPNGDSMELSKLIFHCFDSNMDGLIDFREFVCALSTTMKGTPEDKLGWVFKLYDLDHSGFISASELLEILKAISKLNVVRTSDYNPAERAKTILKILDKDEDGKISSDEFVNGAMADPEVLQLVTDWVGL